jgi:hypothetical protein
MCRILNISDTTVTSTAAVTFNSANTSYIDATTMSDGSVMCVYYNSANTTCYSQILSISGDIVTTNTPTSFSTSATTYTMNVKKLKDNSAIVMFKDGGNSSKGTACLLSVSGTTITAGAKQVYANTASDTIYSLYLSPTKVISATNNGLYCISINGSTITSGSVLTLANITNTTVSLAQLSPNCFFLFAKNSGTAYPVFQIIQVSGTTLTSILSRAYTAGSTITGDTNCAVDNNSLIISFRTGAGTSLLVRTALNYAYVSNPNTFVGIAKETKVAGEDIRISYGPEVGDFTGLYTGSLCYLQPDGSIGLDNVFNQSPVGIALSSTKMKLFI